MNPTPKQIKDTIKSFGDDAPARYGVNPTTLARYMKKGQFPLTLIVKVLGDIKAEAEENARTFELSSSGAAPAMEQPQSGVHPIMREQPMPVAPEQPRKPTTAIEVRLFALEDYLRTTVDFYIRQFSDRISRLEQNATILQAQFLRHAGMPSMARPDQNAILGQTFTTNPNGPGNALDTGIAPTKEMVDAQARMYMEGGVPMPDAQTARPAMPPPAGSPGFGFGWNSPRPSR